MEGRDYPTGVDQSQGGLSNRKRKKGIEVMIVEGPDKGKMLRTEHLPLLIGRATDSDLSVPLDRRMSRRHAQIFTVQDHYFLEDLGSTNGTFHQRSRIARQVELFHGDQFVCGETTFRFAIQAQDLPNEDSTIIATFPEEAGSSGLATHLCEAIVVVDMCQSSALASLYGDEQAMQVKRELRRRYLPVVRQWDAQFMKSTGDGYLVTFAHAQAAVGSSIEILQLLRTYNAAVLPRQRLHLRFGLNYGATLVDADGDRHGNAVNMAFRVERVGEAELREAPPAGGSWRTEDRILLTELLYQALPPGDRSSCQLTGSFTLKGVLGQHPLYQVQWEETDLACFGAG